MILNEDFFNDIEIKDEDLTDEEPNLTEEPAKEYNEKTSKELLKHKISESEMVLMIYIHGFNGEFDIWHIIERIMKRLKYMFNIYNINLSEPFITDGDTSFDILENKNFPFFYTIIQHEGCNLYFPERKLREYELDEIMNDYLELFVFLDKKIPVFKTARSAYNFLIGLDKCLWKDITDSINDCIRWCDIYDIDNVNIDNGDEIISTYSNSYIHNDDATKMYKSVLNIVPKKVAK